MQHRAGCAERVPQTSSTPSTGERRSNAPRPLRAARATAGVLAVVLSAFSAAGAAPVTTLTGTIATEAPGTIVLTTSDGAKTVKTTGATHFVGSSPARLSDIKAHDFLGVDARKNPNGSLSAVSINIFPALWEGRIREGQWLMTSGDTMTNAVVTQYVEAVSGHVLTMTHQGATYQIAVPPSASIHRLALVARADVRPGMHATVRGAEDSDGSFTATVVIVERPTTP